MLKLIQILSLLVIGCQNNKFNLTEGVPIIEIYEWDSDELVAIMEGKEFIDELVKALDNAKQVLQ